MRKLKWCALSLLTFFCVTTTFAQEGPLSGTRVDVLESESNGVEILWQMICTAQNAQEGKFELKILNFQTTGGYENDPATLHIPDSLQVFEEGYGYRWYKFTSMHGMAFGGPHNSKVIDFSTNKHIHELTENAIVNWPNLEEIVLGKSISTISGTVTSPESNFVKFSVETLGNINGETDETFYVQMNRFVRVINGIAYNVSKGTHDGATAEARMVLVPRKWLQDASLNHLDISGYNEQGSGYNPATQEFVIPDQIATTQEGRVNVTEWDGSCFTKIEVEREPPLIKTLSLGPNIKNWNLVQDLVGNIVISSDNPYFVSDDGVVYTKNGSALGDQILFYPQHHIPNEGTDSVGVLKVPGNIKKISEHTFANCTGITVLDLSKCKDLELLEPCVWGASNITEIRIPRYVKKIVTPLTAGAYSVIRLVMVDPETNLPNNSAADIPAGKSVRYWTGTDTFDPDTYGILFTAKINNNTIQMGDTLVEIPVGNSLADYKIPAGVKVVAPQASTANGSMKRLFIPETVVEISTNAFRNEAGGEIEEIIFLPNLQSSNLKTIGARAFECSKISSITLPEHVDSIGESSFANCPNLTSFTADANLAKIGDLAFNGCQNLNTLDLSATSLTAVPAHLIRNTGVQTLNLPATVTAIADAAFCEDDVDTKSKLKTITFAEGSQLKSIGRKAFKSCEYLENINIPDGVETIGNFAFMETNLQSIDIPASVTSMGNQAFTMCKRMTSINVNKNNPKYYSLRGVLYAKPAEGQSVKKLLAYPSGKSSDTYDFQIGANGVTNHYSILPSVEEIGDSAFFGCEKLEDIKLPASVKVIGNGAFLGCKRLTNLSIMSAQAPAFHKENEQSVIELFSQNGSDYVSGAKPVLTVRASALAGIEANNTVWNRFTDRIYTSFSEPTTGVEYFPWSENRETANGAKSANFSLEDKSTNADNKGFSLSYSVRSEDGSATETRTWTYDKVAVMGITDAAERAAAKTFIIPATVTGTIGNSGEENKTYDVAVVADSAFCGDKYPVLNTVTMQGNPEYIAANAFNAANMKVYFPNMTATTKPLASVAFADENGDAHMGPEFAENTTVFVKKSIYNNSSAQLMGSAYSENVEYKIPVDVNDVAGQSFCAGTFSREFDVDFTEASSIYPNLLLFWVMKNFTRPLTGDETVDGISHYWNAWSFPSTQKYQLKAGDGVLVRIPNGYNPSQLFCTIYEGNTALKAVSQFNNPENSVEEGVIKGNPVPNALVGVYARTYLTNGDANGAKAYTAFKVNCDGTPSGQTGDVNSGYIMGWSKSKGKFTLPNASSSTTGAAGQFTAFKAFLATGLQTLPTDQSGNPAKFFMMSWDGDASSATDIRNIVAGEDGDAYFTLGGTRVEKPTDKGIYIHNGKKIVVK